MKKKKIICIIPARGGSQRIKNKNILKINNLSLLEYTLISALKSKYVKENIYISSDSINILDIGSKYNVNCIMRPDNISDHYSSSEVALIHVLDEYKLKKKVDPDIVVFLQCTSPYREDNDIDNAIDTFFNEKLDSLLSVTENKKFLWMKERTNFLPINYDFKNRKREQDFREQFEENGSIYICKTKNLRSKKNRLSGKIGFYKMHPFSSIQIDNPMDILLASVLLKKKKYNLPKKIELIVMDFDGVFTDDYVSQDQNGKESIVFSRKDGFAIRMLKEKGFKLLVLSSEKNQVVKMRAKKLGLEVKYGKENKLKFLKNYIAKYGYDKKNIIYIGNDLNDLECMKYVGFPITVSDAIESVKSNSKIILVNKGGKGAIREMAEIILKNTSV